MTQGAGVEQRDQGEMCGGDTTSQLNEAESEGYPWDHARLVHALRRIYAIIFGWQDALLGRLDRAVTPDRLSPVYRSRGLLTAFTVLGLGFQLLLIAICSWLDRASCVFALFIVGLNASQALGGYIMRALPRSFVGRDFGIAGTHSAPDQVQRVRFRYCEYGNRAQRVGDWLAEKHALNRRFASRVRPRGTARAIDRPGCGHVRRAHRAA